MVVTSHAAKRHAEECRADLNDLRVNMIGFHLRLVGFDNLDIAHHEESGCRDVLGSFLRRGGREEVAGDLLAHKAIKRFILVERLDQVIAISPGVLGEDRVRRPHHVGIAGEVEPVPRPAFAERPRPEQPIDDGLAGMWRVIADERADLDERRRQAREV